MRRKSICRKVKIYVERCTVIERENQILYEKIFKINNKTPEFRSKTSKKSLNETSRKLKIMELNEANQKLFERIHKKESEYRKKKFLIERKETEKVLKVISEFRGSPACVKKMSSTVSFKKRGMVLEPIVEKLVYRQGRVIRGNSYLIEVYKGSGSFKILAFNLKVSQKLCLFLTKGEVARACGDDGEYRKVVNRIDICDEMIRILNDRPLSTIN